MRQPGLPASWRDDLGLTWSKKPAPVTGDWQKLSRGGEEAEIQAFRIGDAVFAAIPAEDLRPS